MSQRKNTNLAEKLAWGAGGMTESLVNSIHALAFPIFSIALGMSPALLGMAQAVPRLVDAFADPIMGHISDSTRTRWGRRRPFIFIGALMVGITLPLIYMPNRQWSEPVLALWFAGAASLFYIGFTIWSIPWSALGLELSVDYNDRTRLQIGRMIFATVAGILVAWVYKLCFFFNSDEIVGVRYVVCIVGVIMLTMGILPALCIREWRYFEKESSKLSLWIALKTSLSNRPFLLLCGTIVFFAVGVILVDPILVYVNIYHVYGGNRAMAATTMGISNTIGVIATLVFLPATGWISAKIGKRHAAFLALTLVIVGQASQFWLVTPAYPFLQIVSRVLFQPGIMLMWTLIPSMIADVCDMDELETGMRREASFSSIYQWIWKLGATFAMIFSGGLISLVGAGAALPEMMLAPDIIFRLRFLLAAVPTIFCMGAILCIARYPITHKRLEEIQNQLLMRNGQL